MIQILQSLRWTKFRFVAASLVLLCVSATGASAAPIVTVNGYDFDLAQFTGATVTYRADADSQVSFDGKLWDNENGVDTYTLGELAEGQYGSDPGDQVTLQDRATPDWLQLNYLTPITISALAHELVIFEITSSQNSVDTEGTSFRVSFNGGGLIEASSATIVSHYPADDPIEDTNMLVFDLYDFNFSNGDTFSTLYIENKDTGSGTSDPDFIFAGIAGDLTPASVPEPGSILLLGLGLLLGFTLINRRKIRI